MESFLALLSMLVVMGIGWLLSSTGYKAIKTQETYVRIYKVTGRLAQFVGVLLLIIGVPFLIFSFVIGFFIIRELLK